MKIKLRHIYFLCILSLVLRFGHSQNIDSLKFALKNAKHDTTRCEILANLAELSPYDEATLFNDQSLQLIKISLEKTKLGSIEYKTFLYYLATAYDKAGELNAKKGNSLLALKNYFQSLKICEQMGDKASIATELNNIASVYQSHGNIKKALEFYDKSVRKLEESGNKYYLGYALGNIAGVYQSMDDTHKALDYYFRSLRILEEIKDKKGIAETLSGIGNVYFDQKEYKQSLEFSKKSLALREEIGDLHGIAESYNNIGSTYCDSGNMETALAYFYKSLKIRERISDKVGLTSTLKNIGTIYLKNKNYAKAREYGVRALESSVQLGFPVNIRNSAILVSRICKAEKDYRDALKYFELYISMRDSISNEENRKASIKTQLKYEYEKKMATDSVEHAKESEVKKVLIAKQESELSAKRNQQYALYGGLAVVLLFAGFMYNRFRLTQKQKQIIEQQKKTVDEKQREVLDSIYYARRIQRALITNEKYISKNINRLQN